MTPTESRGGVDRLLTVAEVAELLRLSVRSVRRLIAEKQLRVVRVGRSVRVRPEDLKSFLDTSGQERSRDAEKNNVEDQ
jgi:excisionase family DNA binding protein